MAQVSDGPQAALMNQHTDAGVDYRQAGRSNQTNLDTHRAAHDEQDRPSERGGDEAEAPPPPENEAEQDQSWDHGEFLGLLQRTIRPLVTIGGT
jgi:hypothetical protein